MKKQRLSIFVATVFLFTGLVANAQMSLPEGVPEPPELPGDGSAIYTQEELMEIEGGWASIPPEEDTEGQAHCFDYYKFQSVQVSLGVEKDPYVSGEIIKVSGEIINENDYPVVDGNVFVRVSKNNENYVNEGVFIVDEFIAMENVAIDKNSQIEGSFEWKIPESLSAGEYRLDYFFSVGKKFNLGGLPFSNEVIIGSALFSIESEQDSFISFNREETKVSGEKYNHIGNWPIIASGERALIAQPIVNTFDEEKEIDIKYDLYYWDSLNEDDLIATENRKITVPANESTILEYEIREVNEPVYYLKITATSGDQKSIVNVRVASNQEKPRLNYPAITKFPISKGENFTLFSCFHNTSGMITSGRVEVFLKDKKGREVGKIDYKGDISAAMSVDKIDMVAENDYEYLELEAKVYDKNNKVVDEYSTIYDCKLLNNCKVSSSAQGDGTKSILSAKNILIIIFIIIVIATTVVVIIEKKKK